MCVTYPRLEALPALILLDCVSSCFVVRVRSLTQPQKVRLASLLVAPRRVIFPVKLVDDQTRLLFAHSKLNGRKDRQL